MFYEMFDIRICCFINFHIIPQLYQISYSDTKSELLSMINEDIYGMIYEEMKKFDLYLNIKFFDLFR